MVRVGMIIFLAVVLVSIGVAMSAYIEYQPKFSMVNHGEPIQVGPVKYVIEPIGLFEGDEKTRPENVFFQIQITAENLGEEETTISGGQMYLLDDEDKKHEPVYGGFSDQDLLYYFIEPKKPITWTTQFDIEFDEEKQYRLAILPTKKQSSADIGIVCLTNC